MNTTTTKVTPPHIKNTSSPFARGAIIDGKKVENWPADSATLVRPLRWRNPRMIFVCAHGDLFHESVPDEWIDRVFAAMALASHHTFQVLTKRPERMREYLTRPGVSVRIGLDALGIALDGHARNPASKIGQGLVLKATDINPGALKVWPLPHVWLGTSVEDQATADTRIPHLLSTPAAVRFISYEPALGPVDLSHLRRYNPRGEPWIDALRGLVKRGQYLARSPSECSFATSTQVIPPELPHLDWVICGGESGPGARVWPGFQEAARGLRDQCQSAGVAFFMKQMAGTQKSKMPTNPQSPQCRTANRQK